MGEEWRAVARREVARRAPRFLEPVVAVSNASDASDASDALRQRNGDLAQYRSGVQHIVDPLHQPEPPAFPLCRAMSRLGKDHFSHTVGARFLALYGERLGFQQPAPACERDLVLLPGQDPVASWHWEEWLRYRAMAMDHRRMVSQKLRLALAYDLACSDAVTVSRKLPARSPLSNAWIQAAELLGVEAERQASAAADDARQMRVAVWMEAWIARDVLSRT